MNDKNATAITQNWIREIVMGLNFCPFAAQPFAADAIRYVEWEGNDMQPILELFVKEMIHLDHHQETATTLIIIKGGFEKFNRYLQLIDIADQLIEKESYSGIYQIASFHPNYLFEGSKEVDPANYTNRSPYPMIHILREDSLDKAVQKHKDIHSIPHNNIARANLLGLDFFRNWHSVQQQG